jgi:hypothetical protein
LPLSIGVHHSEVIFVHAKFHELQPALRTPFSTDFGYSPTRESGCDKRVHNYRPQDENDGDCELKE